MANERIEVEVAFTGTDQAAQDMEGLAGSTDDFAQSLANVTREELEAAAKLERLERKTSRLQSRLSNNAGFQAHVRAVRQQKQAAEQAARAEDQLAQAIDHAAAEASDTAGFEASARAQGAMASSASEATNQAGQMAGALGNAAAVVGTAIPEFQQIGGIVGAVGTAMSALSTSMGPVGVALAGLTVAIPIVTSLLRDGEEQAEATEEANKGLAQSYDEVLQSIERTASAQRRASVLEQGLGTIREQEALLETRRGQLTRLENDLADARQRATATRTDLSFAELAAELEGAAGDVRGLRARRDRLREDIASAQTALRQAREDQAAEVRAGLEEDLERRAAAARRGRRGGRGRNAEAARRAEIAALQEMAREILAMNEEEQARLEILQEEKELRDQITQKIEEATAANNQRFAEEFQFRLLLAEAEREQRQESKEREAAANEKIEEERRAQLARTTSAIEEQGSEVVGVFSQAFGLAIRGQEDFGRALQAGFSELLLRKGEEAVFDGGVALLKAVGLAFENPPAAAAKAAEGAGLIALGASVGAIGAAIAPAAPAGGERPREEPDLESGGGGTTIINFDSPVVTAQTNQELAENLSATMSRGRRQFGGLGRAA